MCKLLIFTNTAKLSHKKLAALLKTSSEVMGKTDDDGFGWSMLNGKDFVGERCLDPEYFENTFFYESVPNNLKTVFKDNPHEAFGDLPDKLSGPLLIHARISTNQINMVNTHPFNNDEWSLIHNGVVHNEGGSVSRKSTNDSEYMIHYLTENGIDHMTQNVSGYYAIGAINRKTKQLLVLKDNIANLYACYVPFLESLAFGTNAEQLAVILSEIGYLHTQIMPVRDNTAFTFDFKGDLISEQSITPLERYTWNQSDYARSMGLNDYDTSGDYNAKTYPINTLVEDTPNDVPQLVKKRPMGGLDFIDDTGEVIPVHRLDSQFLFIDYNGVEMSAIEFLALDDDDQEFCEVYNRETHELVGRLAS